MKSTGIQEMFETDILLFGSSLFFFFFHQAFHGNFQKFFLYVHYSRRNCYFFAILRYPEVIKRLDRLRMETHHLDWRPIKKTQLLEIDENSHRSYSGFEIF